MNPIDAMAEWLQAQPEFTGFDLARGMWVDTATNKTHRICLLTAMGGRQSGDLVANYDSVRITLLGPQNGNSDMVPLANVAYAMRERLKDDLSTCEVAQFKLVGGIIGPGFTTEGRPWYEFNTELIS